MSKYSNEQLHDMAIELKKLKSEDGSSYLKFIILVALRTGTSPPYVEEKIEEYALLKVAS